jgi:rod shape-determining protein MreC
MAIIENVLQRHRDKTVLAVLILASLTLLFMPRPAKLTAARAAMDVLFAPIQRAAGAVEDYVGLRQENQALKRMVASLLMERERLLQFREERERLRRLAAFKEEQFYELVPSEVIGRNIDRFQTMLVIDKGAADSLAVGMPVFSYQGLAGKLTEVFDDSSWVRLLCSKNNPVSCIDKRSRVVGVLEWRHRNQFELTSVSAVEDVAVGDTLVTSGFGGVVPKGFPVAVVTRVGPAQDGLSLRVDARSHVNFLSLEEVFVMADEIPWDRSLFYDEADTLLMRDIIEDPR